MWGLSHAAVRFLAAAASAVHPAAAGSRPRPACSPTATLNLSLAATTDVHGHIRGWDYYGDRSDSARGLARAATVVDSLRRANAGRVILVDAGDLLQGTPLAYVAARMLPSRPNPVIAAMNVMHYDAAVIGNHEFNYGVPYLDSAVAQAAFPMLAANVTRGGRAAYAPFTIISRAGVRIGIVGATTPGSDLWDAANLRHARMHVGDIVPAVRAAVSLLHARGVDAIVVVLHSGLDEPSSYDTAGTGVASENVAARVASGIPGIDALVYGHSHKENSGQRIGGTLVIQPKNWATSVAVVTLPFTCGVDARWAAQPATGTLVRVVGHAEDSSVVRAVQHAHAATIAYTRSVVGETPDVWRADSARMAPTALMELIMDVERRAAGSQLASTAAFDTHVTLGPGPITIAKLAQLYPYDNTLRAVRISGAQLRAYLEQSNSYYRTSPSGALIHDPSVAGYNFDVVSGVSYAVDVRRPVGSRVVSLAYRGKPVAPTDSFTLALNNYRQSGGGGYMMLRGAPVVHDMQQDIRQLLIDEVRRRHVLRESDYDSRNWSFVATGPSL